jgi:hypothetical protein
MIESTLEIATMTAEAEEIDADDSVTVTAVVIKRSQSQKFLRTMY